MKTAQQRLIGIEIETIDGMAIEVGRDPRKMTQDEIRELGHPPMAVLQAIRARCIDCCAGSPAEVRRCVSVSCPAWPFRMATNPWRERREMTQEQKDRATAILARARESKSK
jgi:hypothetical protein